MDVRFDEPNQRFSPGMTGELAWIESKSLSERRSVMVKVNLADVHTAPEDKSPLAFQAEQNVLLDRFQNVRRRYSFFSFALCGSASR